MRSPSFDHLIAMTDEVGLIQHAVQDIPDRSTGYCVDDVARAFMVACRAAQHAECRTEAMRLTRIYLSFLMQAQRPDGRFHNFLSYDRRWLDEVGTPDSIGRAVWALGYGMRYAPRESRRSICGDMLDRALPIILELGHARSHAYAAIGLSHAYWARGHADEAIASTLREIVADLTRRYKETKGDAQWDWFENELTYDNARLCEALLRAGHVLEDERAMSLGLRTLKFYEETVFENDLFVPIGCNGWYVRGGKRARYCQQPLEAASMIDVQQYAAGLPGQWDHERAQRRKFAERAMAWFHGLNTRGVVVAYEGGGCRDGLSDSTLNPNMGAESTLAYLWSALCFAEDGIIHTNGQAKGGIGLKV